MLRARQQITGTAGGVGVITAYFQQSGASETGSTATLAVTRMYNAIYTIRGHLSSSCTFTTDAQVDKLDPLTGALEDRFTTTPTAITGTDGAGLLPLQATAIIRLLTTGIVGRRFLRGHINLSGLTTGWNSIGGRLSSDGLSWAAAYANALNDEGATALHLGVWHRPTPAHTGGQFVALSGVGVAPFFGTLRSRRA